MPHRRVAWVAAWPRVGDKEGSQNYILVLPISKIHGSCKMHVAERGPIPAGVRMLMFSSWCFACRRYTSRFAVPVVWKSAKGVIGTCVSLLGILQQLYCLVFPRDLYASLGRLRRAAKYSRWNCGHGVFVLRRRGRGCRDNSKLHHGSC